MTPEPFALSAAEPASPPSHAYSLWLNTLKASARNSKYLLSVTAMCLSSAISKLVRQGLRKLFLPPFPKVSPVGATNAAGL